MSPHYTQIESLHLRPGLMVKGADCATFPVESRRDKPICVPNINELITRVRQAVSMALTSCKVDSPRDRSTVRLGESLDSLGTRLRAGENATLGLVVENSHTLRIVTSVIITT